MALTIELNLDNSNLKRGLKGAESRLKATSQRLSELSSSFAAKAAVSGAALTGLGFGIKKLVDAYAVQEQAELKLGLALKNTGTVANVSLGDLKKYASGLQQVTVFGDEAILSAQATLVTLSGNITQKNLKSATELMLDFSTVMGVDAKNGALILGKVLADPIKNTSLLTRYGISFTEQELKKIKVLTESNRKAEAQSFIIGKLNNQFGGQAREAAKGTGALTQMSNAIGDVAEALGKEFLPMVLSGAKAVKAFAERMGENREMLTTIVNLVKLAGTLLAARVAFFAVSAAVLKANAVMATLAAGGLRVLNIGWAATTAAAKAAKVSYLLFSNVLKVGVVKSIGKAIVSMKLLTLNMTKGLTKASIRSVFSLKTLSAVLKTFPRSIKAVAFAVKGLVAATGFGLLITFLPELIFFVTQFWGDFVALGQAGASAFIKAFAEMRKSVSGFFKSLIRLDFSGAKAHISKGLVGLQGAVKDFASDSKKIISEGFGNQKVKVKVETEAERSTASTLPDATAQATAMKAAGEEALKEQYTYLTAIEQNLLREQIEKKKALEAELNSGESPALKGQIEQSETIIRNVRETAEKRKLHLQGVSEEEADFIAFHNSRLESLLKDTENEKNNVRIESHQKALEQLYASKGVERQAIIEDFAIKNELLRSNEEVERIAILQNNIEENKLRADNRLKILKDEDKFGKAYAAVKSVQRTTEYKGARQGFSVLATLGSAESKKQFEFQKAVSIANAIIKTYESATSVYAGFSTIPIVGPALGVAGAAAAVSFGLSNVERIRGQQFQPRAAQRGGLVDRLAGTPLTGDHQPFLLEPGELITPGRDVENNRKASEIIINSNQQGADSFFEEDDEKSFNISLTEDASSLLQIQNRQNQFLNAGVT